MESARTAHTYKKAIAELKATFRSKGIEVLKGKNVDLSIVEKADLPFFTDWYNDPEFFGEFVWLPQQSRTEREKWYENLSADARFFFIEKKDGHENWNNRSLSGRWSYGDRVSSCSE